MLYFEIGKQSSTKALTSTLKSGNSLAKEFLKVYMGQNVQEWAKQNLWKTVFKNF